MNNNHTMAETPVSNQQEDNVGQFPEAPRSTDNEVILCDIQGTLALNTNPKLLTITDLQEPHSFWRCPYMSVRVTLILTTCYTVVSCNLLRFNPTSCVANYIIARSMKESKGSPCQEVQGAYQ